jgi:hypothetical protein
MFGNPPIHSRQRGFGCIIGVIVCVRVQSLVEKALRANTLATGLADTRSPEYRIELLDRETPANMMDSVIWRPNTAVRSCGDSELRKHVEKRTSRERAEPKCARKVRSLWRGSDKKVRGAGVKRSILEHGKAGQRREVLEKSLTRGLQGMLWVEASRRRSTRASTMFIIILGGVA